MDKYLIGKAIPNATSYEIQIYDASGNNAIGSPVSYIPETGADISCNLTKEYYDADDLFVETEYKIKSKAKPEDDVLYVESAWSIGQSFKLYEKINIKKIEVEITDLDEGISTVVQINGTEDTENDYDISPPLVFSFFKIGTIEEGESLIPLNFKEDTTLTFTSLGKAEVKDNTLTFKKMSYANAYSLSQEEVSITISYSVFNTTES